MKGKVKKYFIVSNGMKVEVSKEIYEFDKEDKRLEANLDRKDRYHHLSQYSNFDTDELNGEEMIYDSSEESTEEKAERILMIEKLQSLLSHLSQEEFEIIHLLFFENVTEREAAEALHMPRSTIHKYKLKFKHFKWENM